VSYPDIHKQTGWLLDTPDKLPRFEIPDNSSILTRVKQYPDMSDYDAISNRVHGVNYGRLPFGDNGIGDIRQAVVNEAMSNIPSNAGTVGGQLTHNKLFSAYDDTQAIPLNVGSGTGRGNASYSSSGISMDSIDDILALLHELQHAIQEREGFARGGSPEMFRGESGLGIPEFDRRMQDYLNIDEAVRQGHNPVDVAKLTNPELVPFIENIQKNGDWNMVVQQAREHFMTPEAKYRALAGEAEARLTEARMNMTPERRLAQYPYDPAYFEQATGVPLNSLIVRKGDGVAMSISPEDLYAKQMAEKRAVQRLKDRRAAPDKDIEDKIILNEMIKNPKDLFARKTLW
jgi:hypothetical protein